LGWLNSDPICTKTLNRPMLSKRAAQVQQRDFAANRPFFSGLTIRTVNLAFSSAWPQGPIEIGLFTGRTLSLTFVFSALHSNN